MRKKESTPNLCGKLKVGKITDNDEQRSHYDERE